MDFFMYCFLTLLVLGAADPNSQTAISSLASVPKYGERLKTPELTLYLTRDIVRALQDVNLSKKPVSSIETSEHNSHTNVENYNHKIYAQQSQLEKSLKKKQGFVSRFFLPKDKDVSENQEKNDLANFYLDSLRIQKNLYKQLQNSQENIAYNEERQIQTNANSLPYIPVLYTNQAEVLLQEQLQQQWNNILDHNRAQLQASRHQNEHNNQSPPILIHSEVKITKHHPVPVYKLVEVPVPHH